MRALARWGALPLLAAPIGALALGLGDIELRSALNQPFQAEILLVSATPEDLRDLKIVLANRDAYESRGLDRADFLLGFEFRIVKSQAGRDVVRITSRESITEPFVTMLVEMTWPRGRSLREYTVLLDPPVLLPGPAVPQPVQPAQTRPADSPAGGAIDRPAAPPQRPTQPAQPAQPAPITRPTAPITSSNATPPVSRSPAASPGGTYGPVQRAETLWAIAERFRPQGVSMNQMLVAVYEANPQAFAGNMNLLQVGAVLRIPEAVDLQGVARTAANAEVQRQIDEWQGRPSQQARLRLVPPTEVPDPAPQPALPAATSSGNAQARQPAPAGAERPAPSASAEPPPAGAIAAADDRRLLEVQDADLRNLQNQIGAADEPVVEPELPAPDADVAPGVDLESEQLFSDEAENAEAPIAAEQPPVTPTSTARTVVVEEEPSLVAQILDWVMTPLLWIGLGVAALLVGAMWFIRRRREEPEDVTGRWEALESEVDDDEIREATERMRRKVPDESFVVEEQPSRPRRAEASFEEAPQPARGTRPAGAPPADETLSSQTVINLDQADPVAEADFHMAYGLYDQAAELISKALEAAPNRRDLKLKLLEVFFVWGNKDAFLNAAKGLRKETGQKPDADWDKVVIMGKQICPDEALFAEATSAASQVDVDLQAGDSPLDLAFDDAAAGGIDLDFTSDSGNTKTLQMESSAPRAAAKTPARAEPRRSSERDGLDIGERTAAGLEAALFFEDEDDVASETTPDLDSLAVTQESPTVETAQSGGGWGSDSPTAEFSLDAPTVETPTVETAAADAPTVETPTVETSYRANERTVEQPSIDAADRTDRTAEIDLDDLGLEIEDIAGLPGDLGDLPGGGDSDTREQPALAADDALLSATGVTQVLRGDEDDEFEQRKTAVLGDQDATLLAPGFDDNTLTGTHTGTAVLEDRFDFDQSGDTSLVKSLRRNDDGLDLNLDDLSAALRGSDTVEQPRGSSFAGDVFGGNGQTPLDMDVGAELAGADDPTGTEEVSPLDPQTMTEVGTKLDLARAYIDMGDPEGARSILEEVLDEGDPGQRREAQSLIDVLTA